jgi:hypothetical protein
MSHRILLYILILGSLAYGLMALGDVLNTVRAHPLVVDRLEQRLAEAPVGEAETRALDAQLSYLTSPWYAGQVLFTWLAGCGFAIGALGMWRKQRWARRVVLFGAWCALSQMAWVMITSLELYRATGAGMAYQLGLLNMAWVVLILTMFPMERVRVLIES